MTNIKKSDFARKAQSATKFYQDAFTVNINGFDYEIDAHNSGVHKTVSVILAMDWRKVKAFVK